VLLEVVKVTVVWLLAAVLETPLPQYAGWLVAATCAPPTGVWFESEITLRKTGPGWPEIMQVVDCWLEEVIDVVVVVVAT
jgi:hypothetical protein